MGPACGGIISQMRQKTAKNTVQDSLIFKKSRNCAWLRYHNSVEWNLLIWWDIADGKKKTAKYWCIEEWIFIQKHFACDPPLSRKRLRALNGDLTAENISWTPQIQGEHGRENAAEYEVFTAKFEFCWKNKRRKWLIAQKERSISVRNDNDQKISSKKQENMLVKDLTRRGWMNYNPSIKNE